MTSNLGFLRRAFVLSMVTTSLAASTAMAQTPASAPPAAAPTAFALGAPTFARIGAGTPTRQAPSHAMRNGTLIGLASGALLGTLAVTTGVCEDCPGYAYLLIPGFYAGVGAAAGVGIGAIVKAVKHDNTVASAARPMTTTVSLAPILSKTRRGVAFSMTWR